MSRGKHKTTDIVVTQRPRHVDGLDINPVEDGFMIYRPDTDRVHYLNHTAVLILELSNGRNTPARIATLLKNAYGLPEAPEAAWAQAANCSNMTTSECCRFAAEITIAIAQLGAGCCGFIEIVPTGPSGPGVFFASPEIQALLIGQLGKAQTLMAEGLDKGNGDCTNPPAREKFKKASKELQNFETLVDELCAGGTADFLKEQADLLIRAIAGLVAGVCEPDGFRLLCFRA